MSYQLSGKIEKIFELQTFNSGFSKREFVVKTEGERYPQDVCFGCLKEKADLLTNCKPGDRVTVHFDIAGREYNGRYFVNLNAWKIEADSGAGGEATAPDPVDTTDYSEPDEDNIPF